MSYLTITACCATPFQRSIELQHPVQLHSCEEKMALITDVFLTSVAIAVAIGIILTANGLVDLGPLNAISTLGPIVAYAMLGVAGGVVIVDTMILMTKMSCHITRLSEALKDNKDAQNSLKWENAHRQLSEKLTTALANLQRLGQTNEEIVATSRGDKGVIEQLRTQIKDLEERISIKNAIQQLKATSAEAEERLAEKLLDEQKSLNVEDLEDPDKVD